MSKGKSQSYVPLKDLLTKNIDDRVKDYLHKMDGMSVDDIINGTSSQLTTRKFKIPEAETMCTQKQLKIIADLKQ